VGGCGGEQHEWHEAVVLGLILKQHHLPCMHSIEIGPT
jgi:hypothetical protein